MLMVICLEFVVHETIYTPADRVNGEHEWFSLRRSWPYAKRNVLTMSKNIVYIG